MSQKERTIREAILEVFRISQAPLNAEDIYVSILENNLYVFKTDYQLHVVKTRLNRDCYGWDYDASSNKKYFQLLTNGTFWLIDEPIPDGLMVKSIIKDESAKKIKEQYKNYVAEFRNNLLIQLKALTPTQFEVFCGNLVEVYGFKDVVVTRTTKDGGIDGTGKVNIGFTDLDVDFECKKWDKNKVTPR